MKTVSVYTDDAFLFQKIKLDIATVARVVRYESVYDLCLFDVDTSKEKAPSDALTMSRSDGADIKIPFALGTVHSLLENDNSPILTVDAESRCAYLRGEKIKLTEVELSLLSLLYERGEYVTREEILSTVWGGEADAGVINVYIHYLREKLERHGEKIILSSRKCGYRIDEKYLSEGEYAENS